eukprot:1159284-Pelagomonas_calceolata.AAC.13
MKHSLPFRLVHMLAILLIGHSLHDTDLESWEEEENLPRDYPHASPGALLHAVLSRKFAPVTSPTPDSMLRDMTPPAGDLRRSSGLPQLQIPELPTPPSEGFAGAAALSKTLRERAMRGTVRSSFAQTSKARRDLSPIKQRAMAFRAGINKNTGV